MPVPSHSRTIVLVEFEDFFAVSLETALLADESLTLFGQER